MLKKKNPSEVKDTVFERATGQREVPRSAFILLLLIYIVANTTVRRFSQSTGSIMLLGNPVGLPVFSGVFASVANLCIVLLTTLYRKPGFIVSVVALLLQMPGIMFSIFRLHVYTTVQGIFTNIVTLVAIILIYMNNLRVEKVQAKIREQAITDQLTGIPNRFACFELMEELIIRHEPFALVCTDINNFKSINDTMGHEVGNEILNEIASRFRRVAAANATTDFISRPGGDEYLLIIRSYTNDEQLFQCIQNYQKAMEEKITIDDCDYFLTASFGYAEYPTDAITSGIMMSSADIAMHEIKRLNKSERILRYTHELSKTEKNLATERKIRSALINDSIFFHLQPQYNISHELRGFEALARMKDAEGNFISPGEFIPVAEKIGLIDRVDLCVFRKSAMFFGDLIRKTGADITLSVNVSVRHLMKNNFLEEIRDIMEKSGVPAKNLEIEITESIMIDSIDKALEVIGQIKDMGIKIAIDDFGTGYSSLSYLNRFPADLLKVDKSFIDDMNSSDSSRQYVATIISLGHLMNLEVISEGVEEPDQLKTLKEIGCDFIQGFIWGRPLPPEEADTLVCDIMSK